MISAELNKHLETTMKKLSSMGVSIVEQKELPYGVQVTLTGYGSSCKINLYHSKKKGNSIVQAGGDKSFLEMVLQKLDRVVASSAASKAAVPVPPGLRAGSDEAGKGDYFGPLVVAAVACLQSTANALTAMGVGDSKKLSAAKVRELYEKITVMSDVRYSVCSISPREYNRLFDAFKQQGKNSLDTLAMAHGKVFEDLSAEGEEPDRFVVDKFCEMKRLRPWLTIPVSKVELRVRAEDSEPAVAAASIIARSVYLGELARLSSLYGTALTPGAGAPVDRLGTKLVQLRGDAILLETAKVHFANTYRIIDKA
ncbi:MAG: ribonuclease HIII [Candidatus Sabulitectum sp.]|nr:ribonuclease HIII [Candidatus Sabulitectum sp.]